MNKVFRLNIWLFPVLLLVIATLSYGIMATRLGFFGDDWYIIWHLKALGAESFFQYHSWERPWLAYLYAYITPLIGTSPISWHIFGVFTRWLTAISLWWMLTILWGKQKTSLMFVVLVFLTYPGFRQQYASVMYSFGFIALVLQLSSISLMLLAQTRKKLSWLITVIAILCQALSIFSDEYFFGLELFRPLFLWLLFQQQPNIHKQRIKNLINAWLPYLFIEFCFIYWRVFVFKFPTKYQPIFYESSSSQFIKNILKMALDDFFDVALFSWLQTLEALKTIFSSTSILFSLVIGFLCLLLTIVFFYALAKQGKSDLPTNAESQADNWGLTAIGVGFISIFFMGIPFWFVGWQVDLSSGENRFTLPFMLSASLLLVGLVDWLVRKESQKVVIICLIVGLAAAQHVRDANSYRLYHEEETALLQQFLWRAPDLKQGTVILINEYPTNFSSDTVLMSMFNWAYDQTPSKDLKVGVFFLNSSRIGKKIPALEPELPVNYGLRVLDFNSSTTNSLVAYYAKPGCLKIIEPVKGYYNPILPVDVLKASPLSNFEQIITDQNQLITLPEAQFRYKPEKTWCYYFEKAELMSQTQKWQEVVKLAEEANQKGLKPELLVEYIPFIEGYAYMGNWKKALDLSDKVNRLHPDFQPGLCLLWESLLQVKTGEDIRTAVRIAKDMLDCE